MLSPMGRMRRGTLSPIKRACRGSEMEVTECGKIALSLALASVVKNGTKTCGPGVLMMLEGLSAVEQLCITTSYQLEVLKVILCCDE